MDEIISPNEANKGQFDPNIAGDQKGLYTYTKDAQSFG